MNKVFTALLGTLLIGAVAYSIFIFASTNQPQSQHSKSEPREVPTTSSPPHSIENQLGQLFMIGHWSDTPVASTTALIEKYQLGGVVIMDAPENPETIFQWITQWNAVSDTSLFIAIDQEGGPVTRLKGTQFIQTGQQEITTPKQAYTIGRTRGEELATLGINMNFAPVLDTAVNPTSFLYNRTFPENTPAATLAASLISGMSKQNVMAVAKHFPGHADTSTDSHNELPVVHISQSELTAFTQPFAELISQNPPTALMTAHVQFPQIDPLPATLSSFFLTTYLREKLKFSGLIITDDMSMDAIDKHYSATEAAALALEAGADILLLAAKPADIEIIFPFLTERATESPLLHTRITDSYQRITRLK